MMFAWTGTGLSVRNMVADIPGSRQKPRNQRVLVNIGIRSMRQRSSVITAGSLGMFCRDKQCTQWRSQPPIFFGGAKCVILGEQ